MQISKLKGDASIAVLSLFTVILMGLCLEFVFFHKLIMKEAEGVQDDVILSNLAVYKDVDMEALSFKEGCLKISDYNAAFKTFKDHLQKNMRLDNNFNSLNGQFIEGNVTIDEFTIYNVENNYVEILTYSRENNEFTRREIKNRSINVVKTTDNVVVKNTSVHAAISYDVRLLFGQKKRVMTSVDTDVVN
ncbi:hypothetical protein BJV85_001900 [Clostridium acetobutylicum]|uniref:Hypothetical secreted protein n=2 Tax=Clostridium acetobutylicum TaxID=1488 RepID=Q97HN5_CLOAB|nr:MULTISPECIES: hypothetical protein [Clostridium]AAK79935.1 Hypothetical secreted protein [Clostridium acetobutylicum ATCC 824]ADZ21028.1 Hypothetical secreted protein [Clostridium acetobutylicum EA 2018]AEI32106.1 hypothetical protein SMB_G2007 [Clostridium acetobutylicum DSM 1731]AWV79633.1 hypothetical protein DK921_05865 [Clostridium acetobutylicum]MBC2394394.1 hypothetical protein [Clostridium acetobutylicum]